METKEHAGNGTRSDEYNYEHFHPNVLSKDMKLTMRSRGPHPGDVAPDFELEDTEGRTWRLSELRGRPVVLILGSASCPMTRGAVPSLQDVYRDYRGRTEWLMMYVREAHPGEGLGAHKTYEQKRRHADFLRRDDYIAWPVVVDDLEGTNHHAYGMLPNSVFLIDADGRIAFRGDYSHGPSLRRALDQLFAQGQKGVVPEGEDHVMHMLGATTYGWHAIRRSGDEAVHDIMVGMPPLAINLWMGSMISPALEPVAERSRFFPRAVKIGLAAGLGLIALGAWTALRSNRH